MSNAPVILTRPTKQSQEFAEQLRLLGRDAEIFPLFEIEMSDAADAIVALDQVLHQLTQFSMVIFVSPNAVDAMMQRASVLQVSLPSTLSLGVMGMGSLAALARYDVTTENTPIIYPRNIEKTDSESFFEELALHPIGEQLRGQRVLLIRGESGRDFLAEALRAIGALVQQVSAYRRVIPELTTARQQRLSELLLDAEQLPHTWVVTSSTVLHTMLTWAQQLDLENAVVKMQQQRLYVPHVRIAETAKELGFTSITLTASGDEKLLLALQSHL